MTVFSRIAPMPKTGEELYEECAALFPDAFPSGYAFFGYTEPSMKQQLLCRRIRLEQGRTVFTIAPAFVMPYMTGRTGALTMRCS